MNRRKASHVILDLDGTLVDTERLVEEVYEAMVSEDYGKAWDGRGFETRVGKRPLESVAHVVAQYGLPCTPEAMLAKRTELLQPKLGDAAALPGAHRLIKHLAAHGVPMALASSSSLPSIRLKLASHQGWADALRPVVAGEEVENGKPAPDIFLEAARRLGAHPSTCLVIEDSPAGVTAAKAAGMQVIAVPSLPSTATHSLLHYADADDVLSSLLDLHLEHWGLPPFQD